MKKTRPSTYIKIFLLLVLPKTSAFALQYPLPSLGELGVISKITKTAGRETMVYFNSNNHHQVIYQYDREHRLESLEIRDQFGKTLEKTRFLKDRIWKETPGWLNEWITKTDKMGIHRRSALTGTRRVWEVPYEEDLNSVCSETDERKQLARVVKDLEPELTNQLGSAKIKSSGCEVYPDGEQGLLKDMQEALKKGTKCLMGKSSEGITSQEPRDQGLALRAFFENPAVTVNLACAKTGESFQLGSRDEKLSDETVARAVISPSESSPAILINMSHMGGMKKKERSATLFHEMLHWLGILHTENFDTPYIASECCMADDPDSPVAKKACELLNMSPRPDVDSEKYLAGFSEMMAMNGKTKVPLRTIQASVRRKMKETPLNLNAQYQAALKMKGTGNSYGAVMARALAKMDPSIKVVAQDERDQRSEGFNEAVVITGDLLADQQAAQLSLAAEPDAMNKSMELFKTKYAALMEKTQSDEERTALKKEIRQWIQFYAPTAGTDRGLWLDLEKSL